MRANLIMAKSEIIFGDMGGGSTNALLVTNVYGYSTVPGSTITIDTPISGTLKMIVMDYYGSSSLTQNGTTVEKLKIDRADHMGTNYWEFSVTEGDTVILTKGTSSSLFAVMAVIEV